MGDPLRLARFPSLGSTVPHTKGPSFRSASSPFSSAIFFSAPKSALFGHSPTPHSLSAYFCRCSFSFSSCSFAKSVRTCQVMCVLRLSSSSLVCELTVLKAGCVAKTLHDKVCIHIATLLHLHLFSSSPSHLLFVDIRSSSFLTPLHPPFPHSLSIENLCNDVKSRSQIHHLFPSQRAHWWLARSPCNPSHPYGPSCSPYLHRHCLRPFRR